MFTSLYVLIKFDINVEAANSRSIPVTSTEHGFTVSASLAETMCPNSECSCTSSSWFVIANGPVILFPTYCSCCQLTVDNQPERPTRRCASVYFVTVGGTCDRETPSFENSALMFFLKGRSYFGIAFSRKE